MNAYMDLISSMTLDLDPLWVKKKISIQTNIAACLSLSFTIKLLKTNFICMNLYVFKVEPPFIYCGWLSPKLLTCLRLAQITDGERKREEGEEEGEGISGAKHAPARQKT